MPIFYVLNNYYNHYSRNLYYYNSNYYYKTHGINLYNPVIYCDKICNFADYNNLFKNGINENGYGINIQCSINSGYN